jgi:hypothetical protein
MLTNKTRAAVAALSLAVVWGTNAPPAEAGTQQAIDETRAATRDGTVKVTNAAGAVRIRGWNRDSIAVTGRLGSGSEGLDFSVTGRETRIRVVLPRGASEELQGTELVIRVPEESHVAVRAAAADIDVDGVFGVVDAESVSGGVRVAGNPRMVYAQSAGGDVEVDAATKVIRAQSVDGTVTVRQARGYIDVSTISGDAILSGRDVWEGEVTTVSGRISFEGSFASNGSFYFESHSGDIQLRVTGGTDPAFEIISFSGEVDNALPDIPDAAGSAGLVKIKTFKGSVDIDRN